MTTFAQYLAQIDSPTHRDQFAAVLQWVAQQDPQLTGVIKWNQPMFTAHGTFILGFFAAQHHFTVGPEQVIFDQFLPQIKAQSLKHGKKTFQISFDQPVPYDLLGQLLQATLTLKATTTSFWWRG